MLQTYIFFANKYFPLINFIETKTRVPAISGICCYPLKKSSFHLFCPSHSYQINIGQVSAGRTGKGSG